LEFNKQILDHGYIKFVEHWGSDERIIEAARMSTGKGFLGWGGTEPCTECVKSGNLSLDLLYKSYDVLMAARACTMCKGTGTIPGDERLLAYLYTHWHHTPFEMAGMVIEIQAPIMVFREWHRHRTQSYNELSARYTPLPDVNYLPSVERCLMVNAANKQANAVAGAAELTHESVLEWLEYVQCAYQMAQGAYEDGLRRGIPKELARLPVPVGRYSRMRASANLRNWLAFLTLRSTAKGPNAQWEIRQYADAVADIVRIMWPRTYELFSIGH
jgi:thymidylate synthase (FAD)